MRNDLSACHGHLYSPEIGKIDSRNPACILTAILFESRHETLGDRGEEFRGSRTWQRGVAVAVNWIAIRRILEALSRWTNYTGLSASSPTEG